MNVLYCGDSDVRDGIFLSVLSLCKNTTEKLDIYILTADVDERCAIDAQFADRLDSRVKEHKYGGSVTLINASEHFLRYLPEANMGTRFTPLCMLRLFSDEVEAIPDRILYLDADVLCRADPRELYHSDIEDIEIAGVPDRYGKWFFGNVLLHNYLNSGVLMMNMRRIRESGLFEKCRRMCRDKRMFMPDQSALNKLAVKRKLPEKYNAQGRIRRDTIFKHFTTFFRFFPYVHPMTVKPWQPDKLHDELKIFEFDDIINEWQRSESNESK